MNKYGANNFILRHHFTFFMQLCWVQIVTPFQINVFLLYPLKTSENMWFSYVFWKYIKGKFNWNMLRVSSTKLYIFLFWANLSVVPVLSLNLFPAVRSGNCVLVFNSEPLRRRICLPLEWRKQSIFFGNYVTT